MLHSLCHTRGGKSTKPSLKFPKPDKHNKDSQAPRKFYGFLKVHLSGFPCHGPARPQQNLQQQETGSPVGQGMGAAGWVQAEPHLAALSQLLF